MPEPTVTWNLILRVFFFLLSFYSSFSVLGLALRCRGNTIIEFFPSMDRGNGLTILQRIYECLWAGEALFKNTEYWFRWNSQKLCCWYFGKYILLKYWKFLQLRWLFVIQSLFIDRKHLKFRFINDISYLSNKPIYLQAEFKYSVDSLLQTSFIKRQHFLYDIK